MINWDMSNLKYSNNYKYKNPIEHLLNGCSNLNYIKMSGNLKKEEAVKNFNGYIFRGIPIKGELTTSRHKTCNILLYGYLPKNWIKNKE